MYLSFSKRTTVLCSLCVWLLFCYFDLDSIFPMNLILINSFFSYWDFGKYTGKYTEIYLLKSGHPFKRKMQCSFKWCVMTWAKLISQFEKLLLIFFQHEMASKYTNFPCHSMFSPGVSRVEYSHVQATKQLIDSRSSHQEVFSGKAALQLYWNHTSAWVFSSKFAAYFHNTFSKNMCWWLLL